MTDNDSLIAKLIDKNFIGGSGLRKAVASEALDYEDSIENFFITVSQGGCASGAISSMLYYTDTRNFYDEHYIEIEDLRIEFEEETGEPLKISGDLKSFFTRFAFEETAHRLSTEMGLAI